MTNGLLIYGEILAHFLIHVYDFATAPLWILLYMRKILFYFLSVWRKHLLSCWKGQRLGVEAVEDDSGGLLQAVYDITTKSQIDNYK
jgi:hypothetical protein